MDRNKLKPLPSKKHRVLILGVSGMLGSAIYKELMASDECEVYGAARNDRCSIKLGGEILAGFEIENYNRVQEFIEKVSPNTIINCIGLIKQLQSSNDPRNAIYINALFPHLLEKASNLIGARLIHFSTDCIFSGRKGDYIESDFADADDIYGRTKFLGELTSSNGLTLRTSIIGHELYTSNSLLEWFLRQKGYVYGYKNAIFSGLPTTEIATILNKYVLTNPSLSGSYHLSSAPISKYELLKIIKDIYSVDVEIIPSEELVMNRSLNCNRFINATNFKCRDWKSMIETMHLSQLAA
jgi:dTDP-4-dehydrorhamnose reductase